MLYRQQVSLIIGEIGVTLQGGRTRLTLVEDLWKQLFALSPAEPGDPCLRFQLTDTPQIEPAPKRPPNLQEAGLDIWRVAQGFLLQCGRSRLLVDWTAQAATVDLHDDFWDASLQTQREFFLLGLLMLLLPHRRYGLHANGVVGQGTTYLLVGSSGSGKTTLTMTLCQLGWGYMGDDALLLKADGSAVAALAFRLGFACTPQTLALFPALAAKQPPPFSRQKVLVHLNADNGHLFYHRARPQRLIFSQIVDQPASRLEPVDQTNALVGLMHQSAGLLVDQQMARRQTAVLQSLVQQAPGYRLLLGRDLLERPQDVADLLATIAE